ncbi:PREDICTED: uncharacterized protein LOC105461469, partial [Wasmannia auropunctata]|uniref:uncharacterized protein LOC105461469 n=1 Tax=Wasmannia auropunctata TaxID=64793 RepID=UPI0005EF47E0
MEGIRTQRKSHISLHICEACVDAAAVLFAVRSVRKEGRKYYYCVIVRLLDTHKACTMNKKKAEEELIKLKKQEQEIKKLKQKYQAVLDDMPNDSDYHGDEETDEE